LWTRERKDAFLALSFILSALAVCTKTEGLMFAFVNAIVVMAYMVLGKSFNTKGIIYAALSILMIITDVLIWRSLGLGVNSDFASSNAGFLARLASSFERIPAILYEYQIQLFGPKKWNIVWMLFLAGTVIGIKKWFLKELMPLTVALLSVFLGYTAVYMLSSAPQGIGWHLSTTGSRLFIHFVPIAALWLAVLSKEFGLEV
jgi:hypothetical protein